MVYLLYTSNLHQLNINSTSTRKRALAQLMILVGCGHPDDSDPETWVSDDEILALTRQFSAAAAAPAEPSRRGGNSRFSFNNHKAAAYKRSVAPDRALTQAERQDGQQLAAAEWAGASQETKDHWETVHQTAVVKRGLLPLAVAAEAAEAPPAAPQAQ